METMTVKELIKELEKHGDALVFVTWEGTVREITPEHIYTTASGDLYIDGDDNFYKKKFQAGEKPY